MEEIAFCKIPVLLKSYYLFTTVKDSGRDGFHLTLCNGNDSWEGDISGDGVHDQCSQTNLDYENYVDMTVQALTGKSCPEICFQYQVDHVSADSVQFSWKKHMVKDDVKFRLGSTKLTKHDDNKTIRNIFDHCIEKISNLNHKIVSTRMDNDRLSQERANALKRLDNCVSAKEKLEEDLYSKFLMVLNSKKKEIVKLRKKVDDLQCDSKGSNNESAEDENSSAYSVETENDELEDVKPSDEKKAKFNDDSLVFTDDSLDESLDSFSRPKKARLKKADSAKPGSSKTSSEYGKPKIKEEKQSFGANMSADTSDLLDDF